MRWTLLLVLLLTAPALAQNNSLLRRPGAAPAAPTSQPADGVRDVLLVGQDIIVTPPAPAPDAAPPLNPVLLGMSHIAVAAPPQRRIQPHDLVTIIVREDKRSTTDANLTSEKSWTLESELRKWFRLDSHGNLRGQTFDAAPTPGADFEFENTYEGKGRVGRSDSLTLRITAEVVDVKPNGNVVLEARNRIKNDEEVAEVTLTGACRSEDITPQNTVLSTQLASLSIDVQHSGAARDAARRGWLMRVFDFIKPL